MFVFLFFFFFFFVENNTNNCQSINISLNHQFSPLQLAPWASGSIFLTLLIIHFKHFIQLRGEHFSNHLLPFCVCCIGSSFPFDCFSRDTCSAFFVHTLPPHQRRTRWSCLHFRCCVMKNYRLHSCFLPQSKHLNFFDKHTETQTRTQTTLIAHSAWFKHLTSFIRWYGNSSAALIAHFFCAKSTLNLTSANTSSSQNSQCVISECAKKKNIALQSSSCARRIVWNRAEQGFANYNLVRTNERTNERRRLSR